MTLAGKGSRLSDGQDWEQPLTTIRPNTFSATRHIDALHIYESGEIIAQDLEGNRSSVKPYNQPQEVKDAIQHGHLMSLLGHFNLYVTQPGEELKIQLMGGLKGGMKSWNGPTTKCMSFDRPGGNNITVCFPCYNDCGSNTGSSSQGNSGGCAYDGGGYKGVGYDNDGPSHTPTSTHQADRDIQSVIDGANGATTIGKGPYGKVRKDIDPHKSVALHNFLKEEGLKNKIALNRFFGFKYHYNCDDPSKSTTWAPSRPGTNTPTANAAQQAFVTKLLSVLPELSEWGHRNEYGHNVDRRTVRNDLPLVGYITSELFEDHLNMVSNSPVRKADFLKYVSQDLSRTVAEYTIL